MDESPILVEQRSGYRVITLNRPQRLNAFTEDMHKALREALAEAERDENCRALLLTGAGRGFSSGQDLNDRLSKAGDTPVLGGALEAYYNPLVRKLRSLPFPVVAAVNGVAARRRLQHRARLRHRSSRTLGNFRAVLCQDRAGARLRRHLDPPAIDRPRACPRPDAHR
jgi:hypothetical protein